MQHEHSNGLAKFTHIASLLVVLMYVVNAGLIMANRSLQEELVGQQSVLSEKSAKISQNSTFANINQSLIQALVTAVVARKDEQIKALLIQNQVNVPGLNK